jgi:hypothetical protein
MAGVRSTTGRRRAALVVACAAVVVVVALLASPAGQRQLALSFTRQPTPFTELYFTADPPVSTTTPRHPTLSFTLANHETAATTYTWVVTVVPTADRGAGVSTRGTVTLPVGSTRVVETPVTLPSGWRRVVVTLLDRPETLSYLHRDTP